MTPTKEEQLAAYVNYLTDKFKMYNIFFQDFEAWKKRQYPTKNQVTHWMPLPEPPPPSK